MNITYAQEEFEDVVELTSVLSVATADRQAIKTLDNYLDSSVTSIGCPEKNSSHPISANSPVPTVTLDLDKLKFSGGTVLNFGDDLVSLRDRLDIESDLIKDLEGELDYIFSGAATSILAKQDAIKGLCSNQKEDVRIALVSSISQKLTDFGSKSRSLSEFAQSCGFSKDQISLKAVKTSVAEQFTTLIKGGDGKDYSINFNDILAGSEDIKSVLNNVETVVDIIDFDADGNILDTKLSSIGKIAKEKGLEMLSDLDLLPNLKELKWASEKIAVDASIGKKTDVEARTQLGFISAKAIFTSEEIDGVREQIVVSSAELDKSFFTSLGDGKLSVNTKVNAEFDFQTQRVGKSTKTSFNPELDIAYTSDKLSFSGGVKKLSGVDESKTTVLDQPKGTPQEIEILSQAQGFQLNGSFSLQLSPSFVGELKTQRNSVAKTTSLDISGANDRVISFGYAKIKGAGEQSSDKNAYFEVKQMSEDQNWSVALRGEADLKTDKYLGGAYKDKKGGSVKFGVFGKF